MKLQKIQVKDGDILNALWYKFGGGMDYFTSNNLYLRAEFLYGFRLINKFENDLIKRFKEASNGIAEISNIKGRGMEIKLAVGLIFD